MTRPPFPTVWDNTMRGSFISCPRKFFWEFVHQYKSSQPNIHPHAGGAWASALEAGRLAFYVDGLGEEEAQAVAMKTLIEKYGKMPEFDDDAKALPRMAEALSYYFTVFPFTLDAAQPFVDATGKPMVEFSFVLPLDEDLRHPETGDPILYSGRADMIATYAGAVTMYDDKTTGQLGPQWGKQWDMRAQFTGYVWAALAYGIPVTQVLVRGIAIYKTKIDHAQAITARSEYRVNRWHEQAVRDIRRALACWEEGWWDYNEDETCNHYGGCRFRQPCQSPNPKPWLDTYFIRKIWDPVTRSEIILTPDEYPQGEV